MRLTSVPLRESDLVRCANANGFRVTEAYSPPGKIASHAHRTLSLTILVDGSFEESYLPIHKAQECRTGSVLVRPSEEPHANQIGRLGGRTLSIEIEAERLDCHGLAVDRLLSLEHRCEGAFLDVGLGMSQELRRGDASSGLALESLSLELVARLIRVHESRTRSPAWLRPVLDTLHDRLRDPRLRMSEIAAQARVHPVYLARVFRQVYRVTPGEYVRRLRLEWAKERILNSAEPLSDLALQAGFADQSHLSRAFRARYGVPPAHLRKK
jgi:AraC family transcriptional regulator